MSLNSNNKTIPELKTNNKVEHSHKRIDIAELFYGQQQVDMRPPPVAVKFRQDVPCSRCQGSSDGIGNTETNDKADSVSGEEVSQLLSPWESLKLFCAGGIAEIPLAAMDLDKQSVWGSLKQKTRPFLQNLSVRKTKKRSGKMLERKGHSLDRCLSVSVPDMLEVETLVEEEEEEEETTYSSAQALSSCSPKSFSRSVVSLKSRKASVKAAGEEWLWASQQRTRTEVTVTPPDAQAVGVHLASSRGAEAVGSPVSEGKGKSSEDLLELLQSSRLSDEGTEYPCGEMDFDSSLSSQNFDDQMALEEANDCLSDLPSPFAYLLTIHLREGRNLVIRDRCDPDIFLSLNPEGFEP
ncbi:hypothetical protein DV515_00006446 [Chloebia gouldiae]|uniref:Uncharacterized protein n=1 Tax=Chloebia gouldiae TaxID=44316 RepID=A0A3L8SKC2_CHLGU|nr:hypothetical protein DV515_00006446 [Chloebia gouldiae]